MLARHHLVAAAIALAIAACHQGGRGGGPTCDKVGARMQTLAEDDLARQGSGMAADERDAVAGVIAPMRDTMVRSCRDDHWSLDARGCFVDAANQIAFTACEAKLSGEQRQMLGARAAKGIQPK